MESNKLYDKNNIPSIYYNLILKLKEDKFKNFHIVIINYNEMTLNGKTFIIL